MKKVSAIFLIVSTSLFLISCDNDQETFAEFDFTNYQVMISEADSNLIQGTSPSKLQYISRVLAAGYNYHIDSTMVEIPEDIINLFFSGLVHIYSNNHPEDLDDLSIIRENTLNRIGISFSKNAPWSDDWESGIFETDVPELQKLIQDYGLSLVYFTDHSYRYTSEEYNGAVLESDLPYSMIALSNHFLQIPEIKEAGLTYRIIQRSGFWIHAEVMPNYIIYTFEHRFGDCPSGCLYSQSFTFSVSTSGEVKLTDHTANFDEE